MRPQDTYEKIRKGIIPAITTPHEARSFPTQPMNCPHHCEIYKNKPHSYKELPIRYAEFGNGLSLRASGIAWSDSSKRIYFRIDAQYILRPDQVKTESFNQSESLGTSKCIKALGFTEYTGSDFLRDPENPTKYIGCDEN